MKKNKLLERLELLRSTLAQFPDSDYSVGCYVNNIDCITNGIVEYVDELVIYSCERKYIMQVAERLGVRKSEIINTAAYQFGNGCWYNGDYHFYTDNGIKITGMKERNDKHEKA